MALVRLDMSPTRSVQRVFGASLIATGVVIALVLHFSAQATTAAILVAAVTGVAGLVPLVAPDTALARWIYVVVSVPALIIGNIVSVIVVSIFYYALVTPLGLIMRAAGRDPLRIGFDAAESTYWVPFEDGDLPPESYERQF